MGPTMAGTLLGAGLHWLWIALLVTGLFVVTVLALRLKLPSRVVDPATPVNP
jgi:predicted MFS family arabinose efflux permease